MLFDPKWEVQTKPDVFSLESLITWLEKQPANREYAYDSIHGCLACQYFRAMGFKVRGAGSDYVRVGEPAKSDVDDYTYHDFMRITVEHPRTFGAALDRARKALAS